MTAPSADKAGLNLFKGLKTRWEVRVNQRCSVLYACTRGDHVNGSAMMGNCRSVTGGETAKALEKTHEIKCYSPLNERYLGPSDRSRRVLPAAASTRPTSIDNVIRKVCVIKRTVNGQVRKDVVIMYSVFRQVAHSEIYVCPFSFKTATRQESALSVNRKRQAVLGTSAGQSPKERYGSTGRHVNAQHHSIVQCD